MSRGRAPKAEAQLAPAPRSIGPYPIPHAAAPDAPARRAQGDAPPRGPLAGGVELLNKPPHWNESLHCWCLNFRGRVKLASVKNFQLIAAHDADKAIVMQFGKVDANIYIMDFNPAVISAAQAFSISLSTFDSKVWF